MYQRCARISQASNRQVRIPKQNDSGSFCRLLCQLQFVELRGLIADCEEQTALMPVHFALLRAVNVGGRNPVRMAKLCDLLTELGFVDVRSLLQTGNLVFRSRAQTGAELEVFLEAQAAERHDLHTDFFVRTEKEWKQIIANNPFPEEAKRNPSHLLVVFLKRSPSMKESEQLQAAITGPEIVSINGREVYIVYPGGIGRSRVTNAFVERKLGTRGTARNWNTILKLEAIQSNFTAG
jgi:uncharacterized protein (DUF1697 family)